MGYRYIGSKARIADSIMEYVGSPTEKDGFFIDAFSGTGAVAEKAADRGWNVHVNDMMHNALIMSEARLLSESDIKFDEFGGYYDILKYLNSVDGRKGYIWREYSPASVDFCGIERRYFTEANAMKIDGVSEKIHALRRDGKISNKEFALLMTDVISATNSIANIAGTYGCFLSKWTAQSSGVFMLQPSELRKTSVNYVVSNDDVFQVKSKFEDTVYLDPPYTKRQYASYYHILETIIIGDEPIVEGVSGLRPWKDKASVFCYKQKALNALVDLIKKQNAHRVIISYSNEGHVKLDDLVSRLEPYGTVILNSLGEIGRYRPNQIATNNNSAVEEYLIEFQRNTEMKE